MKACDERCSCAPNNKEHSLNPNTECTCDDCYLNGFHCDCGHDTCLAPYGDEFDFQNRAVKYYRYCLIIMGDGLYENQAPLSPVEWAAMEKEQ